MNQLLKMTCLTFWTILISLNSFAKDKTVDPYDPEWIKCTNNIPKVCKGHKEQLKCRIHEFVRCNEKNINK